MDFRMFILQSHYQSEANFTWETLDAARSRLNDLRGFADRRFQIGHKGSVDTAFLTQSKSGIQKSLDNNLNTPDALSKLSRLIDLVDIKGISPDSRESYDTFLVWLDEQFGFNLRTSSDISSQQKQAIVDRTKARNNQNWALSDKIRDELLENGIGLKDTSLGTVWYRL